MYSNYIMSQNVFAIQNRSTKCYLLFSSTEECYIKDAQALITSKVNKFFELCPDVKKYKIGPIDDFEVTVMSEINAKSGEQYEEVKEDEYCMNTNIDKCIEMLTKKQASTPRPKRAPAKPAPAPAPEETTENEPKPKPKPRAKKPKIPQPE